MDKNFDAVIVGAGMGGLGAALEASRRGLKILLLEQHNLPGGFASSFIRGRFEFEPSLHQMPGFEPEKSSFEASKYLIQKAGLDIDFVPVPEAYRLILTDENLNIRVPFGIDNFIDTIEEAVPGSRDSVRQYMDLCREIRDCYLSLAGNRRVKGLQLFREYGNFIRTASVTATQVADHLGIPHKARSIMEAYWCYLGTPMDKLSFNVWSAMLISYIDNRAVIPRMRSHEISVAVIDKIRELGGEIRFNSKVTEIITRKRRVTGIRLSSGEEISCRRVISNASPTLVYNHLVYPRPLVPKAALRNINTRKHGVTLFAVYLGLNKDHKTLGLNDYSYIIAPHLDTVKLYDAAKSLNGSGALLAATCLNTAIPDTSPPGTSIVSLVSLYKGSAWTGVKPSDYFTTKRELADKMISQFEDTTGIRLRDSIEELEIATPQTFARYTGAYNGCVYGYELEPWDGVLPRILSEKRETYISGLYFCGGFSVRSHGFASSLNSGIAAVERILQEEKIRT